jgi:hypothetical protein
MTFPQFGGEEVNDNLKLPKVTLEEVFCEGCNAPRNVNSVFAQYLNGKIGSCAKCRQRKTK